MKKKPCEVCGGVGWLIVIDDTCLGLGLLSSPGWAAIEVCDACGKYVTDLDAARAFFRSSESDFYSMESILIKRHR